MSRYTIEKSEITARGERTVPYGIAWSTFEEAEAQKKLLEAGADRSFYDPTDPDNGAALFVEEGHGDE